MLSHREVRILRRDPGDAVGVRLWDGRLFLYNAGGSHHFAGAHYIASEIKMGIPLRARLEVIELRIPAIRWLLAQFIPIAVPRAIANELVRKVALVLGAAYALSIPGGLVQDAELLLIPAVGTPSALVADLFERSGMPAVSDWFDALMQAQRVHGATFSQRFPSALLTSMADLEPV
ncbi:hypothetical protein WJ44_32660 [Burkholderia ubonensis]|nr:hypothetical protein WJ44_32660 [Burkholderia ubonensis]